MFALGVHQVPLGVGSASVCLTPLCKKVKGQIWVTRVMVIGQIWPIFIALVLFLRINIWKYNLFATYSQYLH
jgi:hypothetical protein